MSEENPSPVADTKQITSQEETSPFRLLLLEYLFPGVKAQERIGDHRDVVNGFGKSRKERFRMSFVNSRLLGDETLEQLI